ncbi:phage tail protein I [Pandoraea fibrosis]|uniref:Phage tail protein I n=1 Tax=Pandoraea fibrosis TaxID=1891094 RepID=A0A5E4XFG2_9BURK|nr:phage tail protein I [Pandoraea fibrosis]VVE35124.1 phage tail protein I [Pandoraea fibrosis]
MANLLPSNATALEQKLAQVGARISDIPVPITDLIDSDNCPERFLPWLAWHFCVLTWRDDWPVAIKRAYIKSAIPIARQRGTVAAVEAAVASLGSHVSIREWFNMEPPGKPHTFDVTFSVAGGPYVPPERIEDIIDAVRHAKPLREHFKFYIAQNVQGAVEVAASIRVVMHHRVSALEETA